MKKYQYLLLSLMVLVAINSLLRLFVPSLDLSIFSSAINVYTIYICYYLIDKFNKMKEQ